MPAISQEWHLLARMEPAEQRRTEYAGPALVFAEYAGCLQVWQQVLEEWNVWESKVVAGWKREGHQQGEVAAQRRSLLRTLQVRFPPQLPPDLIQAIQQTADLDLLTRWFDAALTVPTLDAFRVLMQAPPAPSAQQP